MSFLMMEDAAQMGELGKRRKGFLKRMGKLHRKLSPVHMIKKAVSGKKKRGPAAAPADTSVPDALTPIPQAPIVTAPTLDQPSAPGSLPTSIPLMQSSGMQTMNVPTGGGGGGAMAYSGGTSPMDATDEDTPDMVTDITDEDTDIDPGYRMPKDTRPSAHQAAAEAASDDFIANQTSSEVNNTSAGTRRTNFNMEGITPDGKGYVLRTKPGYDQTSVLPRFSQADLFDRATNPHHYKPKKRPGVYSRRHGMIRRGRGVNGLGEDPTPGSDMVALAQATQAKHQAWIDQAGLFVTVEVRQSIRDNLDTLRQTFVAAAMELTGVSSPDKWAGSVNPDFAIAYAVQHDIADTEARLAGLANGAAFQKYVVESLKYSPAVPPVQIAPHNDLMPTWMKWAVGAFIGMQIIATLRK